MIKRGIILLLWIGLLSCSETKKPSSPPVNEAKPNQTTPPVASESQTADQAATRTGLCENWLELENLNWGPKEKDRVQINNGKVTLEEHSKFFHLWREKKFDVYLQVKLLSCDQNSIQLLPETSGENSTSESIEYKITPGENIQTLQLVFPSHLVMNNLEVDQWIESQLEIKVRFPNGIEKPLSFKASEIPSTVSPSGLLSFYDTQQGLIAKKLHALPIPTKEKKIELFTSIFEMKRMGAVARLTLNLNYTGRKPELECRTTASGRWHYSLPFEEMKPSYSDDHVQRYDIDLTLERFGKLVYVSSDAPTLIHYVCKAHQKEIFRIPLSVFWRWEYLPH